MHNDRVLIFEGSQTANWAPSGGNLQPWTVYVLQGEKKDELIQAIKDSAEVGFSDGPPEYNVYPPNLAAVYMQRRREIAKLMYTALGIQREDTVAREKHFGTNWRFFDAPVGLIITLDRQMEHGQFCDVGMFMQSVMLLATENGLGTCAQASWAKWPKTIARVLKIPSNEMVFAGIALGYPDSDHPVNDLRVPRRCLADFVHFTDSAAE